MATPKKTKVNAPDGQLTARQFLKELIELPKSGVNNSKFFREEGDGINKIIGVRMGALFALAKKYISLSIEEIEKLLDNNYYEARMGAVCIMDFQARDKKTSTERKKELFDTYMNRHDRINNWDMVDRSAAFVVGGYLADKPRAILYKLAKSKNVWERRTSIVSTWFFIRQNDVDDTFKIAEILVNDKHDLIQKAVGSWVREAGKRDKRKLFAYLDKHASTMPRVTLRYAIEKLDKKRKEFYLNQ